MSILHQRWVITISARAMWILLRGRPVCCEFSLSTPGQGEKGTCCGRGAPTIWPPAFTRQSGQDHTMARRMHRASVWGKAVYGFVACGKVLRAGPQRALAIRTLRQAPHSYAFCRRSVDPSRPRCARVMRTAGAAPTAVPPYQSQRLDAPLACRPPTLCPVPASNPAAPRGRAGRSGVAAGKVARNPFLPSLRCPSLLFSSCPKFLTIN